MTDQFFYIFLGTILIVRLFLFLFPRPSPTLLGLRLHHYMYGLAGLPIALLIHSLPLYAISLAFFVDELTLLLMGGKTHEDNYSKTSLLGTTFFILVVFLFKDYLVSPFMLRV